MQNQWVKNESPTALSSNPASINTPIGQENRRRGGGETAWRRSYDMDDKRAQVSQTYWDVSANNENALRFFEAFAKTVTSYSAHIRKANKPLPISMNGRAVLDALLFYMDGKTGRCDPCLDTIQKKSNLSRRTVVRQLDKLRELKIINWVRRTVKTGNAKGKGPQRQQTSNAYFIDMLNLPIEIVRTLRQKLGDKLRETAKHIEGSGKVPNRMAIKVERLAKTLSGAFAATGSIKRVERQRLASSSSSRMIAHMYDGDPEAMREHLEMLGHHFAPNASATLALYPSDQNLKNKD